MELRSNPSEIEKKIRPRGLPEDCTEDPTGLSRKEQETIGVELSTIYNQFARAYLDEKYFGKNIRAA